MISNLKRYKNDIARLKRMIESVKAANPYWNYIDGDVTLYGLSAEPPFYKVQIIIAWRVPVKGNIIVSEDKSGVVYLGIDLSKVETAPYNFNAGSGHMNDAVVSTIKRSYLWDRKNWEDYIRPYCGIEYDAFNKNPTCIERSKVYSDVESVINKAMDTFKADITLNDGAWPKLENRQLYPILVVDFSKANVSFQTSDYAETSRQAITTLPLNSFGQDSIKRHSFSKYLYFVKAQCQYGKMS